METKSLWCINKFTHIGKTQLLRPYQHQTTAVAAHLELALCKQCAELCDALGCDGAALWLVLGHLVLQGDEANGGALLFLQAKKLQDALVVVNVAVDEDEQDLEGGWGLGVTQRKYCGSEHGLWFKRNENKGLISTWGHYRELTDDRVSSHQ